MALETVVYLSRTLGGDETAFPGVVALQRGVRGSLAGTGGGSQAAARTCNWHVDASTLAASCKRGDRLAGADGTWEVLEASLLTLGARWQLLCRKVG